MVAWALADDRVREVLFEKLGLHSDANYQEQVKEPFIDKFSSRPGDIDLLACDRSNPRSGTAVEFKRVKVLSVEGNEDDINRVNAISKAHSQIAGLLRLGLHRTYLGIIVVVDGQESGGANFLARGASDKSIAKVVDHIDSLCLPEAAGVFLLQIVQPTNKALADASMVSVGIAKQPRLIEQTGSTTEKVARLFRLR